MGYQEEVSVIIPFYNAEKYISTCVASLKAQTCENFRAYFIDDGSKDDSVRLIKSFKDDRFVLIQQEKKGVSAARNLGLDHASGEYLAFVDVDDEFAPDYLEKLVAAASENHVDVVLCNYIERYADGRQTEVLLPWPDGMIDRQVIQEELIPGMIAAKRPKRAIKGLVWRTFTRRKFWEATKLRFNEEIFTAEDLLLLLALYNRTEKIYILQDCLYIYRRNSASTLNSYDPDALRFRNFHKALIRTLEEEGLISENFARCQANEISGYTTAISNLARGPSFTDCQKKIKLLRDSLISEAIDYKSCTYIGWIKKLSLWMLEHRMYSLLLILFKGKEWFRLKRFF